MSNHEATKKRMGKRRAGGSGAVDKWKLQFSIILHFHFITPSEVDIQGKSHHVGRGRTRSLTEKILFRAHNRHDESGDKSASHFNGHIDELIQIHASTCSLSQSGSVSSLSPERTRINDISPRVIKMISFSQGKKEKKIVYPARRVVLGNCVFQVTIVRKWRREKPGVKT